MKTPRLWLAEIRKEAGLSQEEVVRRLANKEDIHVTRQSYSRWELGDFDPDMQTAAALARVLEFDAQLWMTQA